MQVNANFRNLVRAVLLGCLPVALLLGAACSTTKTVVPAKVAVGPALKAGTTIIVMPPLLTYETTGNEAALDGTQYGSSQLREDLHQRALEGLRSRGFVALESRAYESQYTNAAGATAMASGDTGQLLRGVMPGEVQEKLRTYGSSLPEAPVFIQYMKIKIGPGGSWDPNSGAITSAMHTSQLRAALIETQTGKPLWRDQFLLREIATVKNKNYQTAVQSLYSNPNKQQTQ